MSDNAVVSAFLKAQMAFKPAVRDSDNPHFKSKFVSLQGVLEAVEAALHANGFAIMQPTAIAEDGRTVVVTTLWHESGGKLTSTYPVTASQAGPQGEGSGLTYARRYALMSLLGIAPEDDDGNAAQAGAGEAARAHGGVRAASPSKPTASQVRGQIATIGAERNLTPEEIADDFVHWSQGTAIGAAKVDDLLAYVDHIQNVGG